MNCGLYQAFLGDVLEARGQATRRTREPHLDYISVLQNVTKQQNSLVYPSCEKVVILGEARR